MLWKIALVYTIGILISEPVYIWAIRTLTKMEDEDERLYCSDNGEYYEPGKPNYPALVLMVIIGGLIWPLALLFGIFIPITFILMDKMGQLHPDDEDFDQDEDNFIGGRDMSLISNSGHDENGKYLGGKAGDQTGTEWALIPWYNRPWKCVLRHPDAKVRAKLAELGVKAAKNNLVGYDQNQRGTYWQHLKASNYDPAQITIACEADCSAGVIANIKATGYLLGIDALKNISATYTGNLRAGAKAAGFQVLTESKFLTGPDYLLAGDILLNDSHHTATNVQDGAKVGGSGNANSGSGGTHSGSNSKSSNVENGQKWLNSNYGDKLIKYCGAKLNIDGDYGPACRRAALAVWKDLMNRKYGTELTPSNENFYASCKKVAGKATVQHGSVGTFTFLVQFILAGKGYYTGAMDATCGDNLDSAIEEFQRAKNLTPDKCCGPDTWYALFN